ncbi:AAA family ATPase [Chondromyces crocatus]|uniref:Chromosome segregation protein SMC n=1 Tax=Chondromyces crocatus TaxID=52 RepID=A0A0K1E9C7_CHOCO|nr:AAA family ATPase [Chondromyces crocatus]AKT37475.1 chromosome segregation protein SMC [Chondromyces crocatus]
MRRVSGFRYRAPARVFDILKTVTIEGFKSIRKQNLELGYLNVFIGANGSGKTALLEALGVLGAAAAGRVDDAELLRRGVRPGVPRLFKSAFDKSAPNDRLPRVIKLSGASPAGARYDVTLDNPKDSAATPWRFSTETLRFREEKLVTRSPRGANLWKGDKKEPLKLADAYRGIAPVFQTMEVATARVTGMLNRLAEFVIYDPQTAILRGTMADALPLDPLGLQGGRLAEAVGQLLQPKKGLFGSLPLEDLFALIDWASDVDVSAPTPDLVSPSIPAAAEILRFTDKYLRSDLSRLSAYDASEGALYVLFALTLLLHPRTPRLFAVENIDHALHPRLARALVRLLGEQALMARNHKQVLLTTHNPLVLDGLALNNDRIRLFTVDRTTAGHTVVHRVAYTDALEEAQAKGVTLSQMWTRGLLGAVPSIE